MTRTRLLELAAVISIAACNTYDPTASTQSTELVKVSGGGKDVTVLTGEERFDSLVVRVIDGRGRPVPGINITWTQDDPGGLIAPFEATTDVNGIAWARWTTGGKLGVHKASAAIADRVPVEFSFRVRSWDAKRYAMGANGHRCALSTANLLVCSRTPDRLRPVLSTMRFDDLVASWGFNGNAQNGMCALSTVGRVWCADMRATQLSFVEVAGSYPPFKKLSAGGRNTFCAITWSGELWCWGSATNGLRADGINAFGSDQVTTIPVRSPYSGTSPLVDVALGWDVGCALAADGVPWCWGSNEYGVVDPSLPQTAGPFLAHPVDASPPLISLYPVVGANGPTVCGLVNGGRAVCWGVAKFSGRISADYSVTPGFVASDQSFASLAPVLEGFVALDFAGTVHVWGTMNDGHLPHVTVPTSALPTIALQATDVFTGGTSWGGVCLRTVGGAGIVCLERGEWLWPQSAESGATAFWTGLLPPIPIDSM